MAPAACREEDGVLRKLSLAFRLVRCEQPSDVRHGVAAPKVVVRGVDRFGDSERLRLLPTFRRSALPSDNRTQYKVLT
jgi:hypothetical protein